MNSSRATTSPATKVRHGARLLQAAISLAALSLAAPAGAYCRTTTCDPEVEDCGCDSPGLPLYWKSSCVSFDVQENGSPLRGVPYDEANAIVADAFAKWENAQCEGGANPQVEIEDLGAVQCGEPQYNQTAGNANVWIFRDDDWPYGSVDSDDFVATSALAVTAVTFNPETGEIYDADVEINSENVPLTTTDENVAYDLSSIVTHEAGHFLGLNHSFDGTATMTSGYLFGDVEMRTLSPDDEAGICAIYPPNGAAATDSCTPRHGFSGECSSTADTGCCSTAPGRPTPADARGPWLSAALAGLVALVALRRRGRLASS